MMKPFERLMVEDAIRGARGYLKHLKKLNEGVNIYDDEIKKVRNRLSKYGAMKERMD